jgi:hypothetical protein
MSLLLALVLMLSSQPRGVVVNPVANMYSAPREESDVVSQAIYGTNVVMEEEKAGWAKVRTADDYTGWMPLASLRPLSPSEAPYASVGRVAQVESLFANLYREPDVTKHQPLLTVPSRRGWRQSPNRAAKRVAGSQSACRMAAPPGCSAGTSPSTPSP